MADQLYQPIVSDADDESETPSPRAELDIPDPVEFRKQLDDERDDLTAEEATVQRSRRPDPESPESAYERPLVHIKTKAGPISVNEASDAIRWGRSYKLGSELREAGLSERQVGEMADDAIKRGEGIEPLAPPPPEVKGLDEYGREDTGPISVEEGANQTTDWRQRQEEARQEALVELAGEAAQHAQAEAQAQQVQPEPQPQQQQPQQLTAEQQERQQLAAERQRIAYLKKMEGHEAAARLDYDQLVQAVANEFPSLRNGLPTPEQVADLARQDPARHQKLMMADQMLRERQARIASLAQQRNAREQQQAQADAQARAAARAEQDKAFEQLAAQHIPGWERNHTEVRAQARKTLESAGLTPEQLHYLWNGDHSIDVHSSVLQLILAKAAQWDLAQQRAHQIRQAPVPPVMKPGAYRARDDGAQSVRDLQMRLKGASGRRAIEIGAELTRAKRTSGG
jgi:hypothetical protein